VYQPCLNVRSFHHRTYSIRNGVCIKHLYHSEDYLYFVHFHVPANGVFPQGEQMSLHVLCWVCFLLNEHVCILCTIKQLQEDFLAAKQALHAVISLTHLLTNSCLAINPAEDL
jgi:hypothetical protein